MDPIGYLLHGHPVCRPCFDDSYLLASDGLAYPWPVRGAAVDVRPIHAGAPHAADRCAGCGCPLAPHPPGPAPDPHDPDDGAPFRPDDGPTRLALAAARLQEATAAVRRCLAAGDLDPAASAPAATFHDLAARLDAATGLLADQPHPHAAGRPAA